MVTWAALHAITNGFLVKSQHCLRRLAKKNKPKRVARNVMEGGYTAINIVYLILLTEPQGKLKIWF